MILLAIIFFIVCLLIVVGFIVTLILAILNILPVIWCIILGILTGMIVFIFIEFGGE